MTIDFKSALNGAAQALGLSLRDGPDYVRGKKPGAIGRHLIRREQLGPFYRQIGVRHLRKADGTFIRTAAVVERYSVERTLHATKGWRTRNRAEAIAII